MKQAKLTGQAKHLERQSLAHKLPLMTKRIESEDKPDNFNSTWVEMIQRKKCIF